jgi:predicted RNA-binding protein with PUA-like domain
MKTEPDVFSIDTLQKMKRAPWDGVRNFQARNFMKTDMKVGDQILFYHSSTTPPGVAGLARVSKEAFPDHTSWEKKSPYYDPRSTPDKPLWFMVEVEFVEKFPHYVTLDEIRGNPRLQKMLVLRRGMRLSIQPVGKEEFGVIVAKGRSTR